MQDMSFTLSVANASTGPFVEMARQVCLVCVMNEIGSKDELLSTGGADAKKVKTVMLTTAAAFVQMRITWSSGGGPGGCADLCDWAVRPSLWISRRCVLVLSCLRMHCPFHNPQTDVYEFQAYSPGALPYAAFSQSRNVGNFLGGRSNLNCSDADFAAPVMLAPELERSLLLTGDAVRLPVDSDTGSSVVVLTPPEPRRFGAVEYAHVFRPGDSCSCHEPRIMLISAYVWLGASASMPGEGLAISLVDARRQTPGSTRFKRGCGTRPALPEAAVSIVLDTSDSDPSCDEAGTGARVVVSLEGGTAAPLVMCSTLDMSTAGFRKGEWLPVQFDLLSTRAMGTSNLGAPEAFLIWRVYVNGTQILEPSALANNYLPQTSASGLTLESFYLTVSARTGDLPGDRHAVSGVRVECFSNVATYVENWDGFRQPLTPPPASPPWTQPPAPLLTLRQISAPAHGVGQLGAAASFGIAFACSIALMVACLLARRQNRAHASSKKAVGSAADCETMPLFVEHLGGVELVGAPSAVTATGAANVAAFHAFLSYRRTDRLLVDTIHDKLRLTGLRVIKDVDGPLAGKPFDAELLRTMRSVPVFAPVITLPSLQRLASAAVEADAFLAELLTALRLLDTGELRLIHPLLVGPDVDGGWGNLLNDTAYHAAIAALPDAASAATVALVQSTLCSAGFAPLPAHLATLTVREVLLGRAATEALPAVAGVLGDAPFTLACAYVDLGLYLSRGYTPPIWQALGLETLPARS